MKIKQGDRVLYVGKNKALKNTCGTVTEVLPVGTGGGNQWVAWRTDSGQEARSTSDTLVKA